MPMSHASDIQEAAGDRDLWLRKHRSELQAGVWSHGEGSGETQGKSYKNQGKLLSLREKTLSEKRVQD